MTDIEITTNSELMIAQLEAVSPEGRDVIDAFIPKRGGAEYSVMDSGRILIHTDDLDDFKAVSERAGLTSERTAHSI